MKNHFALRLAICIVATLVILVVVVPAAFSQDTTDQPPTIEQCHADIGMLKTMLQKDSELSFASALHITEEAAELQKCEEIDHDNIPSYVGILKYLYKIETLRLSRFLARHDLVTAFLAEDTQGTGRKEGTK